MRVGVMFDTGQPFDEVVAQVAALDAAGIESAWGSQIFAYDTLTLLAAVAREVPRSPSAPRWCRSTPATR